MPHSPISHFPMFRRSLYLSALVAAASVFASAAFAQLAPQRTWPELKEAVQQRADRNAYPMTSMKADDVREILGSDHRLRHATSLPRATRRPRTRPT